MLTYALGLELMNTWLVPPVGGAAPQTYNAIRGFYVLPLRQYLMGSVATIVVAPLGTYACGVELSSISGRTCTYVVRTVEACIRIHRNNDIREGALL